jgi:hypothetical protein
MKVPNLQQTFGTILFFLIGITQTITAQSLDIVWDKNTDKKIELYDFIQTSDGKLIGVGESLENEKSTYGAIAFFDSLGTLTESKLMGSGKEGFRAVAQTQQGTLILVGWTEKRGVEYATDAWLVEMDFEGSILKDTALGTTGKDIFEKIAIREDGSAIVCGFKNQGKSDGLWLLNYSRKKGFNNEQETLKGSKPMSIEGIMALSDNRVLMSGNTKDEDVWVAILEKNGTVVPKAQLGAKGLADVVLNGVQTYDDKLLLTGETYSKGGKGSNAWLIELDANGNILNDDALNGAGEEKSVGAAKVLGRKFALVVEAERKSKEIVWLHSPVENTLSIKEASKINIAKIINLQGNGNEFLIVGNVVSKKQKAEAIRLIKVIDSDYLVSKEAITLQCSNPQLQDDSQDTTIGPEEYGNLNMTITNPYDKDITNLKIQIALKNEVVGLKYQDLVNVSYIEAKGKKTIFIPLQSGKVVKDGIANFEIVVKQNGQEVCRTSVNVKCISRNVPRLQKVVTLISPLPANNNTKRAERSEKAEQMIKIKVQSNRPLSNGDLKVFKNKKILKDSKAPQLNIGNAIELNGFLVYDIQIAVSLDTGINDIEIGIEDEDYGIQKTERISIEYAVHKPTLHIVAIAPTYENLKYNQKDVNDLLDILAKQSDSGIYESIVRRPLLTRDWTSLSSIKAVFEELSNQFESGDIHPSDVLMVYYSGHGKMVKNEFRLLPSDYRFNAENSTTINYERDILEYLKKINCKKVVLLDACHSGASGAKDDDFIKADDLNAAIDKLNKTAPGMITISSCSRSEKSYESDDWKNSAFSKALCEAFINKKVDLSDRGSIKTDIDGDGLITLKELIDFIEKRVPDLVKQKKGEPQTPHVTTDDFDRALRFWRVAN